MKDQEARTRLDRAEFAITNLEGQVNCGLKDLRIEECPKCKHDTLNVIENVADDNSYLASTSFASVMRILAPRYVFTCLTCGAKWEEKPKKRIINKKGS